VSEPAVAVPLLPPLAQDCDIHIAPEALLPHRTPLAVATSLGEACAAPRGGISYSRAISNNIRTASSGGLTSFQVSPLSWNKPNAKEVFMRHIKLHRAIILAGAIAPGCASVTIDALARSGAGS
jgi:hypothetical protein